MMHKKQIHTGTRLKFLLVTLLLLLWGAACSQAESTALPILEPSATLQPSDTHTTAPSETATVDLAATTQAEADTLTAAVTPTKKPTSTRPPTRTPTLTPTPLSVQGPGWEGVEIRSVCLEVQQRYPEFPDKKDVPIETCLEAILGAIGLAVVADPQACDATLEVSLSGKAAADTYRFPGEDKKCYNGSSFQGEMVLTSAGGKRLVVKLAHTFTPRMISTCNEKPTQDTRWAWAGWIYAVREGLGLVWFPNGKLLMRAELVPDYCRPPESP